MTNHDPLAETLPASVKKRGPSPFWLAGFLILVAALICGGVVFVSWQWLSAEPDSLSFDDLAQTATARPGQPVPPSTAALPTTITAATPAASLVTAPAPSPNPDIPTGQIVFVCQIFRSSASDQICVMNADGSDWRRITTRDNARHFYPSFAPEGRSVLFVSNMSGAKDRLGNVAYDVYEQDIFTGELKQLTNQLGIVTAPEVSPDGTQIVFKNSDGRLNDIWLMNRDGSNPRRIYGSQMAQGWDPTWSPDGRQILFAGYDQYFAVQLFIMDADGSNVRQVTQMQKLRGRSDWSPQGLIVTYAGEPWNRELYLMNTDGSDLRQLTPTGGNSQGPSFSPDGNWVAFTAYFDRYGDDNGCEIYIIRIDGSNLRRLTDNAYCDWQPRWGP
ncbi:MAG: hypothetical protein WHV44_03435 [Anaerolineales bacterium]